MQPNWVWVFAPLNTLGILFAGFYFAATLKASLLQFARHLDEVDKLARNHESRLTVVETRCDERHAEHGYARAEG